MAVELTQDVNADIERLFLNEGTAIAGAKPKQMVVATDTGRLVVINAAGNAFEIAISEDSKQMLLAGPQNITGAKTFDAAAIFNSTVNFNGVVTGSGDVDLKRLGLTPSAQNITGDGTPSNEVLLNSDVNSFLEVTTPAPSAPSAHTVGMKAGTYNGQLCMIHVLPTFSIEIDPTVQNSASVLFQSASPREMDASTFTRSALFRWRSGNSTWYEVSLGGGEVTTGTYTAALTGTSTNPTVTVDFSVIGRAVTLQIPQLLGLSNSIQCTVTGMPGSITPAFSTFFTQHAISSNIGSVTSLRIEVSGTMTMQNGFNAGDSTWINDGLNKGLEATSITYLKA